MIKKKQKNNKVSFNLHYDFFFSFMSSSLQVHTHLYIHVYTSVQYKQYLTKNVLKRIAGTQLLMCNTNKK